MTYDVAVVGAGVIGLAHAWRCAARGAKVVVLERSPRSEGASVRNFGMLWPIGQPEGERRDTAVRSRALWLELLRDSGIWHETNGSLHLAYADDEAAVLREFATIATDSGFGVDWWDPSTIGDQSPRVRQEGLRGGLFSAWETCVDPRATIALLPGYLARRYGVEFRFACPVSGIDGTTLTTADGPVHARRVLVCTGHDTRGLFPECTHGANLVPCKLQMMRTAPWDAGRLGPMLAAGLTLRHYEGFRACPSLDALKRRHEEQYAEYDRWGIHVLVSQTESGQLTLGDSHEYGDAITPFDRSEIDDLVLGYLRGFLDIGDVPIVERWHGIYLKNRDGAWFVAQPTPEATVVTGMGGAGMTLSMGLAEKVVSGLLD